MRRAVEGASLFAVTGTNHQFHEHSVLTTDAYQALPAILLPNLPGTTAKSRHYHFHANSLTDHGILISMPILCFQTSRHYYKI